VSVDGVNGIASSITNCQLYFIDENPILMNFIQALCVGLEGRLAVVYSDDGVSAINRCQTMRTFLVMCNKSDLPHLITICSPKETLLSQRLSTAGRHYGVPVSPQPPPLHTSHVLVYLVSLHRSYSTQTAVTWG
jgi:hypothetical protein